MSEINITLYTDSESTGVDSANETINNWMENRPYPWALYPFNVNVQVLGTDFTESESQELFPDFDSYPKITIVHNDNAPIATNKFELDQLHQALRTLHTYIR